VVSAAHVKGRCLSALVASLAFTACRFGGPSADPNAYVSFPSDAEAEVGPTDATLEASLPLDDATTLDAPVDEAAVDDAALDGAAPDAPARTAGDCGISSAVCDPVHNTGCPSFQQCDVDPTQATTPTGVCVFNSGPTEGGACSSSVFQESCPPQSTCVSGACRALCACDSDCKVGECCSDTSGPPRFMLCQACP
jgi:hypothetical protein